MKDYIHGAVVTLLLIASMGALRVPKDSGRFAPLSTVQKRYVQVASVTEDATDLAVDTSSWDNCDDTFIPIPPEWNAVQLSFYGYGDGDGAGTPASTFSYSVYGCKMYGGAELITTGTATIASTDQQMSIDPSTGDALNSGSVSTNYVWADTITEATKTWGGSISYSNNAASNSIASFTFDRESYYGIYVIITGMTSDSVTSVTCVMNGY